MDEWGMSMVGFDGGRAPRRDGWGEPVGAATSIGLLGPTEPDR